MDPMHPGDRTYRNTTIRLADLTVVTDVLSGLTFENCRIHGPAVVAFQGSSTLAFCSFDGDEEGLIWDVGDRQHVIGAVAMVDCTFSGCVFQAIGIAVWHKELDIVLRGLGFRP